MDRQLYEEIVGLLRLPVGSYPHFRLLQKRFPGVACQTFISIYCQESQYAVIKHHHIHKGNINQYWKKYLEGTDILDISYSVNFPPCLLLRRMLESALNINKQKVSEILKCSRAFRDVRIEVQPELRARLQADIDRCVISDTNYSPYSDCARQAAGLEYELVLYHVLEDMGLSFWTEAELREQGLFKTPDAWLKVPIAFVKEEGAAPHIVHWVDSKATFGDERTHRQQMEAQYTTYLNRYGSGLVIYWFGFLEGLDDAGGEVLILDKFPPPRCIRTLRCLPLPSAPKPPSTGGI